MSFLNSFFLMDDDSSCAVPLSNDASKDMCILLVMQVKEESRRKDMRSHNNAARVRRP